MKRTTLTFFTLFLALLGSGLGSGCGVFEAGEDAPFILPLPSQSAAGGGGGGGGTTGGGGGGAGPGGGGGNAGATCTKNTDCAAGKICNTQTKQCEATTPDVSSCTPACRATETCNPTTKHCESTANLCPAGKCTSDQVCNPSTGECLGGGGGGGGTNSCAGISCPAGQVCNPHSGACVPGKTCDLKFTGHLFLEMQAPPGSNDPPNIRTQNIPLTCAAQEHLYCTNNPVGFNPACCCHRATASGPFTCVVESQYTSSGPFNCDVESRHRGNYLNPYLSSDLVPFDPTPFCEEDGTIPNPPSINEANIKMKLTSPNAPGAGGEGLVTLKGSNMEDFMIHDRTGLSEGDFIINGGAGITAPAIESGSAALFSNGVSSKDNLHLENVNYTGSYTVNPNGTIDLIFPFRFRVQVFFNNTGKNNNQGNYNMIDLADDQIIPPLQDPTQENLSLTTSTIPPLARLDSNGQPTDETLGGSGRSWGPSRDVTLATAVVVPQKVASSPDGNSNLRTRIGGGVLLGLLKGQFDKTPAEFLEGCHPPVDCDANHPCPTGQQCTSQNACEVISPCGEPCPPGQTCNETARRCETSGGGGGGGGGNGGGGETDRCAGVTCGAGAHCNPANGQCEAPPPPPTLVLKATGDVCNRVAEGGVPFTPTLRFCSPFKFYKDGTETSTDASKYQIAQTISIRNDSPAPVTLTYPGGTVGPFIIDPLTKTIGPGQDQGTEARLSITFRAHASDAGEVRDTTKLSQICEGITRDVSAYETTLQLSSTPLVSITIQGCAKKPAAQLKITELATYPPFAALDPANPNFNEIAGALDFGEVTTGSSSKRLLRYANIGVKNLGINSLTLVRTGLHYQLSSVRQGSGFASADSTYITRSTNNDSAGPFVTVTPDGIKDAFIRISYTPLGILGDASANHRVDNASLVMQTDSLGSKTITMQGSVNTSLTAKPELWYENNNITTPNPDVSCLNNNQIFKMPTGTSCGKPECNLRGDTSSHRLFIRNKGTVGSGADRLHVTELARSDGHFIINDLNGNPIVGPVAPRFEVNPGECKQIGTITFVSSTSGVDLKAGASGGRIARGVVTLQSNTVNPTTGVDRDVTVDNVTAPLIAVNGAPNGRYTLHVTRMVAGLPSVLTTGSNRLPTTMTPGQQSRVPASAHVGPDQIDHFKIHVNFDAARGTINLDPVFTSYVDSSTNRNPPPPATGVRLFNGPGADPVSSVFRYQCANGPCPFFFIYISGLRPSFDNPEAAIYTGYDGSGNMRALDPHQSADIMQVADPNSEPRSLTGAQGTYDPISGEVTFANSLLVRLFSDHSTVAQGRPTDSTLPISLSTGCIGPNLVPSGASDANVDGASGGGIDTLPPPEPADVFGPNPIHPYAVTGACLDASGNPVKYLKGRRLFTSDTTGTLDLVGSTDDLSNLTMDLAGIAKTKSNISVGDKHLMYLVVKTCLESDSNPNEPGAVRGGCNTCPAGHGNNSTSPTGQCTP